MAIYSYARPLIIAFAVALIAAIGTLSGVLHPVTRLSGDLLVRFAVKYPPEPPADWPDVVIIAIDENSTREVPWPWPRSRHAQAIDILMQQEVLAIGHTVDFSSESDPKEDTTFSAAIERSGKVALAARRQEHVVEDPVQRQVFEIPYLPIPPLADAAAAVGSADLVIDSDGIVRRAPNSAPIFGDLYPSLPNATLSVALDDHPPTTEGNFLIDFRRAGIPIAEIPFHSLLHRNFDRGALANRIVLLGPTAVEFGLALSTPLEMDETEEAYNPVHIQALALRTLIAERAGEPTLRTASPGMRVLWALIISLIGAAAGMLIDRRRLFSFALLAAAVVSLSGLLVIWGAVLLDFFVPLAAVGIHYVLSSEAVRARFHTTLSERDHSLATLFRVGEAAASPSDATGFELSLALLGELVEASGVALLTTNETGVIDGERFEWSRGKSGPAIGDLDTARSILPGRRIRVYEGSVPGRSSRGGLAVYNPLYVGEHPAGVLVMERENGSSRVDEIELRTIATVGTQLALAAENLRLIQSLREKKRAAESASRAKSEFLANMSHEIRTPMNAILGYINLLEDDDEPADKRPEYVEAIHRNGNHLLEIINDILDLSSIEEGRLAIGTAKVSPIDLVADVFVLLESRAIEKQLTLEKEFVDEIPQEINTDGLRLRQILINLVGNAIKFTDSGSVRVRARMTQGKDSESLLRFDVIDTGVGIPSDSLDRIFDAFVQGDTSSTRRHGGTGLGLAISRKLARMLGGTLYAASEPGRGSTFTLTVATGSLLDVPMLRIDPDSPSAGPRQKAPKAIRPELSGRVLVAEDGPDNQRIIRLLLKKAGLQVEIAENGQIAVEMAMAARDADEPFDLVLMDIDMPVLDGYGATTQLREAGFTLPIVALTAHALPGDRERCLDAGCDDYMTKPVKREVLVETVSLHLREKSDGEG